MPVPALTGTVPTCTAPTGTALTRAALPTGVACTSHSDSWSRAQLPWWFGSDAVGAVTSEKGGGRATGSIRYFHERSLRYYMARHPALRE